MQSFRDVPIRTKLTAILTVLVSLALVLVCAAFVVNDVRMLRTSTANHVSALASVLGANSEVPLQFSSPTDAALVLSSLRLEPTVVAACVYDGGGKLFAKYPADASHVFPATLGPSGAKVASDGFMDVFEPIAPDGTTLGTVYLHVSMEQLLQQIRKHVLIALAVLVGSLAAAVLLGIRLQRIISDPILQLAKATETVSTQADYSIRVQKRGNDELGTLYDAFNSMLAQIQRRDGELERTNAELANSINTLRERAVELENEIAARTRAEADLQQRAKELESEIATRRRLEAQNEKMFEHILNVGKVVGSERGESPGHRAQLPTHDGLGRLGQYELLEKLGQGGMGTVYRAMHTLLKRVVALKVLSAEWMHDAKAVARFLREMEAVGKLDHPNIVRASDAGEADGAHFLVMELVDGVDLAKLTENRGVLSIADACEVVRQAATGLQHAHEHGLVHRDVKPSNLMLTSAGKIKVLDLGLARLYGDHGTGAELTSNSQIVGTPDYMAPEQGFGSQVVDIRADVYSLGCTLYKLLAGHPPFSGPPYCTALDKLLAHFEKLIPPIREYRSDVSQELSTVLERLLAKSPSDRFGAPIDVARALQPFAVGCELTQLVCALDSGQADCGPHDGAATPVSGLHSTQQLRV